MRVCPKCGARYEDDAAFCPMDGASLGEPPTSEANRRPPPREDSGAGLRWVPPAADEAAEQSSIATPVPVDPEPAPAPAPGAEFEEEPLIGVVLGDRYRVEARIGSGGMGLVYRATHLLIGRKLAIKVLRRRYAEQPGIAARFAQEARVASSVKHMHIVDLLDFGTTPGGSPYCVMEYLEGHTLAHELAQRGPLAPARALELGCQIGRGLSVAHQAGIIHRDLKPDNVFVIRADDQLPEQAKILDFGIAQVTGRKTRLTASGAVVGTPEYMSPEQARGDALDARSDLYALGVVVFELLTGKVPLTGSTAVGTLTKQVFEHPPRLRDLNPELAALPSIESVLARLLAKNRDERPATALDAVRLLQTAASNDLGVPGDPRGSAASAGWSQAAEAVSAHALARRSTIMIGSGSVAQADENPDGPATGSFSAKDESATPAPQDSRKRPSIIIQDGLPVEVREPLVYDHGPTSRTPTPESNRPLGKPPRRGLRRRHVPFILIGVGAAIFAALVTIGLVRWLQGRGQGPTGQAPGAGEQPVLSTVCQVPRGGTASPF